MSTPRCETFWPVLRRVSKCGATSTGACSTTSSGHSDTARRLAWSRSIVRRSRVTPNRAPTGSARSLAPGPFRPYGPGDDGQGSSIDPAFGLRRGAGDGRSGQPDAHLSAVSGRTAWDQHRGIRADHGDRRPSDRKSTRLNSSHVEISYAV